MAGTTVKASASAMGTMAVFQAQSLQNTQKGDFRQVWDARTGRGGASDVQSGMQTAKRTPGDSLKAREAHLSRSTQKTQKQTAPQELSEEELQEVSAVLESAAAAVIQQTAEILGVTAEELQAAMDSLGMETLDVLEPGKLGELFMAVTGTQDASALITNEALYSDFQEVMGQLGSMLQDASEETGISRSQLEELLAQLQKPQLPEEASVQEQPGIVPERAVKQDAEPEQLPQTGNVAEETDTTAQQPEQNVNAGKDDADGGRETGHHAQSGGAAVQTEQLRSFQPEQIQQTQQQTSAWDVDTQDIMRQIMDYMKVQVKTDMSSMEMQLHPASLGTLQIQLASKGGVVTANFITQNEAVKTALESQMIQLQQSFEEQGIKVNSIEVTVQPHAFEQNLEQGRGSAGQEPQQKQRTRRIRLTGTEEIAQTDEMTQEDALAAQMLAAGGNTVDYTV